MSSGDQIEQIGNMLSVGQPWSRMPASGTDSRNTSNGLDREIRITTVNSPPHLEIHQLPNGSYRYEGYLLDVWNIVAEELHLRYRIDSPADGSYGDQDENGTWSGMVGELAYGRADVALTWLYRRSDRAKVIEYLDPVATEEFSETFYISKNLGETTDISASLYQSLLKPLDTSVWWSLLASIFLLSIVLRIILRASRKEAESSQTVKDMTWGSCLFSMLIVMVGQGWAKTPDSFAARIATLISRMLGIVIYTSYTTNLISYLTVVTVERPISSLEEFSERSDWTLAMIPGHGILNDWKMSNDRHLQGLVERYASGEGFLPITATPENLRKLAQPKVMIYTSRDELPHLLGNNSCQMVTLEENAMYEIQAAFMAMAKGMPKLQAAVNGILRRLYEQGVHVKLKNQWMAATRESACEQEDEYRALSFAEFLPVFAAIVQGLMLSVLLLALEWGWAKLTSVTCYTPLDWAHLRQVTGDVR